MLKIFSFIFILTSPVTVIGDIYRFVDPKGQVYYTDKPVNNAYKRLIRTRALNYSPDKRFTKEGKEKPSNMPSNRPGYNLGSFSSNSKLSLWTSASYKEQANVCESMSNVLNDPKITPLNLCLYLTEMAENGNANFMKISQVAAIYITVVK